MLKRLARRVSERLHGAGHRIQVASIDDLTLEADELPDGWLLDGNPRLRSAQMTTTDNGLFATGVWDSTAGRYHWHFNVDEAVHILEGEVHVTDEAETRILRPGDVAFFPMGTDTIWEVPEYVRKQYIHRTPSQVVRRLERFAA